MEGTGSPASSAAGAFPPPAFFLGASLSTSFLGSFSFFSFFADFPSPGGFEDTASFGAAFSFADLSFVPAEADASAAGAAFFFSFGGSALRSIFGAFSKSNATRENAGDSFSAELRTEGRDWM